MKQVHKQAVTRIGNPGMFSSTQVVGEFRIKSTCCVYQLQRFAGYKSRADRIRTCDLFVPNEARDQPALQLDVM